jgi:hypothetical protein
MRTSSSASLPDLLDREVSDDEEDTVARGAAASASRVRTFRKAASKATGMRCFFSGKKKAPEPLLGGMPLAADVCGKCCERPGDLTCCACAASICAPCSTLTGAALARAREFDTKRRSLYVCKRCGGGLSSTRCAGCSLRVRNDPLEDTVISKVNGTGHHHASLNCDQGPTCMRKCPQCIKGNDCVNCFDDDGDRIADGRPRGDATTAKMARELMEDFPLERGTVLVEKDSGRRATVVEGNGFEATVIYQGSDQPEVVAPYLVFSHYVGDDEEFDCDWVDARCNLCRSDVGNRDRGARQREARALMDVDRATGVQVIVRPKGEAMHHWQTPNPNDAQGRSDRQRLADTYNDLLDASRPQEDDALTGREVCFRVRHTSRCPPVAW